MHVKSTREISSYVHSLVTRESSTRAVLATFVTTVLYINFTQHYTFSSYQAAGNHVEVVTFDILCRR